MRRICPPLALLLFVGCASAPEREFEAVTFSVNGRPEAIVQRIPAALEAQGFQVTAVQENVVITAPRSLPPGTTGGAGGEGAAQWFLHVATTAPPFMGGSRMEVRGYLLPPPVRSPSGNTVSQPAIPVSSRNAALFAELERLGRAVHDHVRGRD